MVGNRSVRPTWSAAVPWWGKNGAVHPRRLSVDDIAALLGSEAAGRPVEAGASFSHLDHALQTAAVLRDEGPDEELAVAGLVHDIGHLLPGVDDAGHAEAGAAGVRDALGERVAGLVGLHVAAKRYLVADGRGDRAGDVGGGYGGGLSAGSVISLSMQGGPMSSDERAIFENSPLFQKAVALRRADDRGKVDGLVVDELGVWMAAVRRVADAVS
jgi:predicted HD phosphohydrolase